MAAATAAAAAATSLYGCPWPSLLGPLLETPRFLVSPVSRGGPAHVTGSHSLTRHGPLSIANMFVARLYCASIQLRDWWPIYDAFFSITHRAAALYPPAARLVLGMKDVRQTCVGEAACKLV